MRLIDGDRLEEVLTQHRFSYCGENEWNKGVAEGFLLARFDVTLMPTIDALEVVRCKDCKYYEGKNTYCANDILATPYDYCSRGERREE